MFASRLPWVSIAARGAPAVPLVNMQHGEVVGRDVGDGQRVGGEQLVEGDGAVDGVAVDGDDVADGGQRRGVDLRATTPAALRSTITPTASTAASSRCSSGCRAGRVERHDDGTEPDGGEVGDDERVAVAADEGDAIARRPMPRRARPPRSRRRPVGQLVVRDRAVAADQRGRRGRRRGPSMMRARFTDSRTSLRSGRSSPDAARRADSDADQGDHAGDEDQRRAAGRW